MRVLFEVDIMTGVEENGTTGLARGLQTDATIQLLDCDEPGGWDKEGNVQRHEVRLRIPGPDIELKINIQDLLRAMRPFQRENR